MDLVAAQAWWADRIPKTLEQFEFVASHNLRFESDPQGKSLRWGLLMFDKAGAPVHRSVKHSFIRTIYKVHPLRGAFSTGPVLFNDMTCLAAPYRGRGLGPAFARLDEEFGMVFKLSELQLNAGCEAFRSAYWQLKHAFLPSLNAQKIIELNWSDWCDELGEDRGSIDASRWASLPEDFRTEILKPNLENTLQRVIELYKALP